MTEKKPDTVRVFLTDGYQPLQGTRGYQAVSFNPKPQGGHQPTTSQGSGGQPKLPNGGSSESD